MCACTSNVWAIGLWIVALSNQLVAYIITIIHTPNRALANNALFTLKIYHYTSIPCSFNFLVYFDFSKIWIMYLP